jgi:hypothetical protein
VVCGVGQLGGNVSGSVRVVPTALSIKIDPYAIMEG